MPISKLAIKWGVGFAIIGGGITSGIVYATLDNTTEYLVEVVWEDATDSSYYAQKDNLINNQAQPPLDEIKGGDEKNYFCQWVNSIPEKDEQCKLINLDFVGTKSLNLTQISNMNNEISKSSKYLPETWFKLKISKNYVFDANAPTKIKIVNKNTNSKIFTTLIPKFKISNSNAQGNVDLFLVKLNSFNTTSSNIANSNNYQCGWANPSQVKKISSYFEKSSAIRSSDFNFSLTSCKIYDLSSPKKNTTKHEKINEINLSNSKLMSKATTEITKQKLENYFIIRLQDIADKSIIKSISEVLKTDSDLIVVYNEAKNTLFATFKVELPLNLRLNNSFLNSNLILLN